MDTTGGFFFSSGVLYRMAVRAYESTKSAPSDTATNQDDALTAILFSAATLEAFINELAHDADVGVKLTKVPSPAACIATVLEEVESSRGSVKLKYLMAKTILSGQPYDKGRQPYQDFDLLFSIRDAIVHNRPEKMSQDTHKIVAALASRGLCEREDPQVKSSWLHQITTRSVARWACNVVRDIEASLLEHIPKGQQEEVHPFMVMAFGSPHFRGVE